MARLIVDGEQMGAYTHGGPVTGRSLYTDRFEAVRDLAPYLPTPEVQEAAAAGLAACGFVIEAQG